MKIMGMLALLSTLLFSYSLQAQYTEQQRADALALFDQLKQLNGLDIDLVLPQYEREYQLASDDKTKLEVAYKIITLANTVEKEQFYYQELLRLAETLKLDEFIQIAQLHLIHQNIELYSEQSKQVLATWREKQRRKLSNRVQAHYLWRLAKTDRSQTIMQQTMQHYLTLKHNGDLFKEQFLLLNSMRRHDQVLEQRKASTKQAFQYALTYQYPINRLTYLYNQIILLIDNAEYELAQQHAEFYLTLALELGNATELFFAYQLNGYVLLFQREFQQALLFFQKAEQNSRGFSTRWLMQNKRFQTRALLHLGKLAQAKASHRLDQEYLATEPMLDRRELHFHNLNDGYISLLESKPAQAMAEIEAIFYQAYANIIAERNNNISRIRELANKELDAKVEANNNFNYLIIAMLVLALFFIVICVSLLYQVKLKRALQRSKDKAVQISRTDSLTQLNNRQFFHERLQHEWERLQRYRNSTASLLILDIDNFKSVNDNFGHLAGDEALTKVGQLLQKRLRNTDVSGRFGGEEFVILLPETNENDAYSFAENLREAVSEMTTEYKAQAIKFTTSIGLATYSEQLTSTKQWLDLADKALYQAKNSGRNKVVSAS